jgi:putative DNA methylase
MEIQVNNTNNGGFNRLIERPEFPFEFISALAERESWRKEIYRPIYHIHKWWAKRLGSVFRGILLGSVLQGDENLESAFYHMHEFPDTIVFDPFMGSGTTIGEAHKLGMTVLGRDINPIASESIRVALTPLNRRRLKSAFQQISSSTEQQVRELYRAKDENGYPCEVLYYFWVKQVECPDCHENVDLFSSYVFAKNAYPKKKPEVHLFCPSCGDIFQALYHQKQVTCNNCLTSFDPNCGQAKGSKACCQACGNTFPILAAVRETTKPPTHKLYAKLILSPQGEKKYLPATDDDYEAYITCEQQLQVEEAQGSIRLPKSPLSDGYNTRQAMSYNYHSWRDFFNARQLLALGWLHESIGKLPVSAERDALLLLFSGTLEFNNLFASYKGEGTGAVRHMFSHHTLKPERMPIEANVWGTSKSSGSFSGLFRSRLLRALDYRDAPFEIGLNNQKKIFNVSKPIGIQPLVSWGQFEPGTAALSCGDSANSGLPDSSVDLIVTDPPFFDNVHYSELADFFYAWQGLLPRGFIVENQSTTRQNCEVQDTDSNQFSGKLQLVFEECRRVLKENGLLVFTYHHSHPNGWAALANAVYGSQFSIVQAYPVRAELAAATPKSQTKEPILIDAIIVCRKQKNDKRKQQNSGEAFKKAILATTRQLGRLASIGYKYTEGDKFVIGAAQFFVALGSNVTASFATQAFREQQENLQNALKSLDVQAAEKVEIGKNSANGYRQLRLTL